MALRWIAAGMGEARRQFRRVNGYLHLPALRAALTRQSLPMSHRPRRMPPDHRRAATKFHGTRESSVRREMHFLTAAQVEQLAAAITVPFPLLVRFDAYTGLRAGELAALRVGRLDLLRGTCEVVESATEVDNKLVWGATKTYERRTVRLPGLLCEQVGAYLADRPNAPNDLVFTMLQGGPLREPKFAERYFKPAARAAGLPAALRVHDLRHTCASLLIRRGREHQGRAAPPGPQVSVDHPGPLRPPVLGGAGPPGRPPGPAARAGWCTQRVPTSLWGRSGKAKGLVGDQGLMVEVGRLELPCLGIRAYRPHAALMAESGC